MSFENPLSIVAACIFLLCPSLSFGNFDLTEKCVPKPCPAGKKYHCLVDENWRQGETCLDNLMVTAGMCPYYNTYRGNLDVRPCEVKWDTNACPKTNYQSYNGDQYSGCMMDYSNMDAASVITTSDYTTMSGTTTAPMTTSPQTPTTEISHTSKTAKSEANKAENEKELPSATPQIIAIIVVFIIIVLALIVISLLYRKYPRFRRFVKGKDHKGQPALLDEENAAGRVENIPTEGTPMLQEISERDTQTQHGTVSVTREEPSSEADSLLHTGNADTETYQLAPEYVPPNPRDSQSYSEDHRNDTERIPSHSIEHPKTISGCQTTEKNHDEEHNDSDSDVSQQSGPYKSCNDVSDPVDEKQDESPNDEVQNEDDITQELKGLDNEHLRANDPITNEINTIEAKDSSKSIEPKPEESDSETKPEETDSEPKPEETDSEPKPEETDSEPKQEETDSEPKPEETDSEPKPERIDSMTSKASNDSSSYNKTSEGDKMYPQIKPTVNVSSSHEDKDKTQSTSSSTQNDTEEIPNTSSSSAVDDQHELSSTQSSAEVNSKSSSRSSNSSVENSYDVQNSTNDNNIIDSNDIDNRKEEIALVKSHSDEDGIRKENKIEASEKDFAELLTLDDNRDQYTGNDLPKDVLVVGGRAKVQHHVNDANELEEQKDMSDKQYTVLENGNDSLRKVTDISKTINAIKDDEFQKDGMSNTECKDGDQDSLIKNGIDDKTRGVSPPVQDIDDSSTEKLKTVENGTREYDTTESTKL